LGRLGEETWFQLGDRDLATCLLRTQLLISGKTLTQATTSLCKRFGIKQIILPPTDDPVETRVVTEEEEMNLQKFWVKNRGRLDVRGVKYVGARRARVTKVARNAIRSADRIVICPGNPVTSIMPILAVDEFKKMLGSSRAKKVALSPMIGKIAFSGPAPKLLRAVGVEPTSLGVAKLYADFLDEIIIHEADTEQVGQIEELGVECKTANTTMESNADEVRLARSVIQG
jgi:LPPG:FO 2-phospho-L-lactate transferase